MAEYRPTYNEKKDAFRRKEFADQTATTLQSILTPLKAAEAVLGLQAQENTIKQQELGIASTATKLEAERKAYADAIAGERAYADEMRKYGYEGTQAETQARMKATLEFRQQQRLSDDWLADNLIAEKHREIEAKAIAESGFAPSEVRERPELRAKILFEHQMKPLRELGLDEDRINSLRVGGGKTAADLLGDPTNYSKSGVLASSVIDRIMAAAKPEAARDKVDLAVEADKKTMQARADIENRPEVQKERSLLAQQKLWMDAREQAAKEIGFDKLNTVSLSSPEGEELLEKRAQVIFNRMRSMTGGAAAAAPAAERPEVTKARKILSDPNAAPKYKEAAQRVLNKLGVSATAQP